MMFATYSQVPGDRRESATCWNRSQDPGGICCPDLQVHRDFSWVHSSQWQNLESHTCWAEPAWREQELSFELPPFSRPNTVLKEWGGKKKRGLCAISRSATWWRLSIAHLLHRVSLCTRCKMVGHCSSPGWSGRMQEQLHQKTPTSAACGTGAGQTCQQATLSPLLGDLGLQYLHLSLLWGSSTASCGL